MSIYRYLMVLLSARYVVDCFTLQNASVSKGLGFLQLQKGVQNITCKMSSTAK